MIQWTQTTLDFLIAKVNSKAPLLNPAFTGTVGGITPTMVGLGNVTNESKATMFTDPTFTGTAVLPSTTSIGTVSNTEIGYLDGVTSAIQTQLGTKAPLSSPIFTGTVGGITSTMVGLGSVNNTSDADKPVSTATQAALNLKANLSSPALTGTPTAPTASSGTNNTQLATTQFACSMAGGSTVPAVSKSANGYMTMANGIIIQWGYHDTSAVNGNIYFPIAFPNTCTSVSAEVYMTTSVDTFAVNVKGTSSAYFSYYLADIAKNIMWIAIGY